MERRLRSALLLLFASLFGLIFATSEPNIYDPVVKSTRKNINGIPVFLGTLREDEREVIIDPPITAEDRDTGGAGYICGYNITGPRRHYVPFKAELINNKTGAARIIIEPGRKLNYEKRQRYKFSIVAFDCGEIHRLSNRSLVIVHIKDADEFPPKFENSTYRVEVEEGHMFESIIKLKAIDADRSPEYKSICGYYILDKDVPFKISVNGVINNTEPLDYGVRHNFVMSVVAESCGKKKSTPVLVTVMVKKMCRVGWKGIQTRLEYAPNSGRQKIIEHAHLDLCNKPCDLKEVSVRMILATKHIGKGCDRDTYSISSQRKLCGASGDSVDLLPSPSVASWTSYLPTDDGNESDQIFAFDGETNAVEIPEGHINHILANHFTISTWMKHEFGHDKEVGHAAKKQHILCMSDGEHLNRHHYALFVHGKKLVFLLRREADNGKDMEMFRPAEWRWHLDQLNDGEWHHYAISVDFPEVRLYIDGKLLVPKPHDVEVVDDWPLHRSKRVHFTELVVGACWQGADKKFSHFFNGYLAGLSVLRDKTESDRVIKCLVNCKEYLDFHALNKMESGTSVSFNSEMTEFSITGKNTSEVEELIREVAYVNARHYPTPGRRGLKIESSVKCEAGVGMPVQILDIPLVEVDIKVMQPVQPVITINSTKSLNLTPRQLSYGYRIFSNLSISVKQSDQDDLDEGEEDDDVKAKKLAKKAFQEQNEQHINKEEKKEFMLDSCTVRADPPLNLREEVLVSKGEVLVPPHTLMKEIELESSLTNQELIIRNVDLIQHYELVLKQIHYYRKGTFQDDFSRSFVLVCSSQNGRFISNEHRVKITTVHMEPEINRHAHAQKRPMHVEPYEDNEAQLIEKLTKSRDSSLGKTSAGPNVGMTAIIVICVGFLLFMIILGVIRIRAAHRRTQVVTVDEKQEMEWDNSALNITVNPMDQEHFEAEDGAMQALRVDTDSDDDGSSCHGGDSSEEEMEKAKGRELEWDDSTLSF